MSDIGIGLIGTGFMGKCHALAFNAVAPTFETTLRPRLVAIADLSADTAQRFARSFGFERATTQWRDLVNDPEIGLVAITTPNAAHKEMALAAIAAGKHVYCEKPLALNATDAKELALAAAAAGVKTAVGYNYLKNPANLLAREMIAAGEIGQVIHFRGIHNEDYMSNPAVPHSWRCTSALAGAGALGDIGSHILSLALFLIGPIEAVCAQSQIVIPERPDPATPGRMLPVDNDDQTHAMLRFAGGAIGTVECSRVAVGRKMHLAYEITGTKGTIVMDQERMNEIKLFTQDDQNRLGGFRRILIGPDHPEYAPFCPAPGHGLGFNDLKTIEVKHLLEAIDGHRAHAYPDFQIGYDIERIMDAILASTRRDGWVGVDSID